ncbi:MAG: hypothetical protein M1817_001559 [Caeruleum heppii]|nr:MAG: hypothetical protein M1817_001559 [Caeruleum heppii]
MGWFTPSYSYTYSSGSAHRHSSSSRRRPRDGYIKRIIHQLKRLIRDLIHYAKRHPVKVFMLVIMPLVTGGALSTVLKQFGIRLPAGVLGGAGRGYGDAYSSYGGRSGSGYSDLAGGGGIQALMRIAQAFM